LKAIAECRWRRVDGSGFDHAKILQSSSGWNVCGVSVFKDAGIPCHLLYDVACDDGWITNSAVVTGRVGARAVDVRIEVDARRRWFLNGRECEVARGCYDLDIGFTPATNTIPIRRLSVSEGRSGETVAALLCFPSFHIDVLPQAYESLGPNSVRYVSRQGAFAAFLSVNSDGLVESYSGLWERSAS
jgi:hypothetical protein